MTDIAKYSRVTELDNFEILSARFRKQRFSRHAHERYGICLIEQGTHKLWCSGKHHIAPKNSLIFINAEEVHDGQSVTNEGWTYQAFFPSMETFNKLQQEFSGNRPIAPWFSNVIEQDPKAVNLLRRLFYAVEQQDFCLSRDTGFYHTMAYLLHRFGKTCRQLNPIKAHPLAVHVVRDYLHDHFSENVTLETLAKTVQLNPYYLARLFRNHIGMPPHRYHIQIRVHKAMTMLRNHQTIQEVALACGFNDQSHLTRHFKTMTGITPGHFQSANTLFRHQTAAPSPR